MSEFVTSTSVTATKLALFTEDNAKANITAITGVYLDVFQDIEAAIYATYQSRLLDNATGAQLDILGALVGQLRGNFSDTDYKPLIRARILVNRSDGTARAITEIVAAMIRGSSVTAAYVDTSDMKFQVSFFDLLASFSYDVVLEWATMINQAKALGSGSDIIYSGTATGHSLVFDTVAGGYTDSVLDTVAGANNGELSAVA